MALSRLSLGQAGPGGSRCVGNTVGLGIAGKSVGLVFGASPQKTDPGPHWSQSDLPWRTCEGFSVAPRWWHFLVLVADSALFLLEHHVQGQGWVSVGGADRRRAVPLDSDARASLCVDSEGSLPSHGLLAGQRCGGGSAGAWRGQHGWTECSLTQAYFPSSCRGWAQVPPEPGARKSRSPEGLAGAVSGSLTIPCLSPCWKEPGLGAATRCAG